LALLRQTAAEVSLTGKNAACTSTCQADHEQCMSGPSMTPIARNNLCVYALRSCAKACPTNDSIDASARSQGDVYTQLKQLKELLDSGGV
jgi:hypothetical protein